VTDDVTALEVSVSEARYAPYAPEHGTPDPMVKRTVTMRTPKGTARFEQTDYGHPGRWNAWEPRGVDPALQPKTPQLIAACEALATLLD
jgi:hypothetical protein